MKHVIKLTKKRGGYYTVTIDGKVVGYCERERNFMATSGYAGWHFEPREDATIDGQKLPSQWSPTPKRAVEGAIRAAARDAEGATP